MTIAPLFPSIRQSQWQFLFFIICHQSILYSCIHVKCASRWHPSIHSWSFNTIEKCILIHFCLCNHLTRQTNHSSICSLMKVIMPTNDEMFKSVHVQNKSSLLSYQHIHTEREKYSILYCPFRDFSLLLSLLSVCAKIILSSFIYMYARPMSILTLSLYPSMIGNRNIIIIILFIFIFIFFLFLSSTKRLLLLVIHES